MTELVFTRRFSMAHRLLSDRRSKCATPHGHNEYVKIRLRPKAETGPRWGSANATADFSDVKRHWHHFIDHSLDHALQLGADDPLIGYFKAHEPDILPRLLIIKGDPTTEALALALLQKCTAILAQFVPGFSCASLELEETPTNTVCVSATDLVTAPHFGDWCHRADLSLNDLIAVSQFGEWA